MSIKYYPNIEQRSPEWFALKCGVLTASNMGRIITPAKLLYSKSEAAKAYLYELVAQRITKYIEPQFQSFDMMRGEEEELLAKALYSEKYAPITDMGFVTNDKWGFTLGCSPDGLVGEDGGVQMKSRIQKFQIETIISDGNMEDFLLQIQTELLVTERKWWDFTSYSNGLNMAVFRMYPDRKIHDAILAGAATFHEQMDALIKVYQDKLASPDARITPVERRLPPGDMKPTE